MLTLAFHGHGPVAPACLLGRSDAQLQRIHSVRLIPAQSHSATTTSKLHLPGLQLSAQLPAALEWKWQQFEKPANEAVDLCLKASPWLGAPCTSGLPKKSWMQAVAGCRSVLYEHDAAKTWREHLFGLRRRRKESCRMSVVWTWRSGRHGVLRILRALRTRCLRMDATCVSSVSCPCTCDVLAFWTLAVYIESFNSRNIQNSERR